MVVPLEYLVDINGKPYVKYEGLLKMALLQGLQEVGVNIIQLPNGQNEHVAGVLAEVLMPNGQRFKDVGDASPQSVDSDLLPHLLRVASTRAKARCLRDALGIGMCSVEELSLPTAKIPGQTKGESATEKQMAVLLWQAGKLGIPAEGQSEFKSLSKKQASKRIQTYNKALQRN